MPIYFDSFSSRKHVVGSISSSLSTLAIDSFLLFLFSFLFVSLFPSFFSSRTHSHSNLFERIIHARYARNAFVWRRVRGDSPSMTFALLHFLLLFYLFFFSPFFSRHYSTHCGCAYFLSRGSPTQIAIVLSWWCFAVMMVGASFQIFAQVRIRARVVNCQGWSSCNWHVLLLNRSKLVDATFAFDVLRKVSTNSAIPFAHCLFQSIFVLEMLNICRYWS